MIDISILKTLEPISTLSPNRMQELATLCFSEKVSKGIDPFRMNVSKNAQAMYLLKGQLALRFKDGHEKILTSHSDDAKHPINLITLGLRDTIALSEIDILRIDLDLLDIVMTWDQLAAIESGDKYNVLTSNKNDSRSYNDWMLTTDAFGISKLQTGIFSRLPSMNIEEMFRRMTPVTVKAGQVIVKQGAEGDFYYLIESGSASVTRRTSLRENADIEVLATLTVGDTFGEEALVSENRRNATITMLTDGTLLRLNKIDFVDLLKARLITNISMDDAKNSLHNGAIWLDVRSPSEYKFDHFDNAINLPLTQIRSCTDVLCTGKQYIAYCQTGRRSSAAAFILMQFGFNVLVLNGGIRGK